ncbi:hypothetical protein K1719_018852 [Acacia pycnantha]|nr:hypothetical protein K1719_018852 [Acacia pycnantha]
MRKITIMELADSGLVAAAASCGGWMKSRCHFSSLDDGQTDLCIKIDKSALTFESEKNVGKKFHRIVQVDCRNCIKHLVKMRA